MFRLKTRSVDKYRSPKEDERVAQDLPDCATLYNDGNRAVQYQWYGSTGLWCLGRLRGIVSRRPGRGCGVRDNAPTHGNHLGDSDLCGTTRAAEVPCDTSKGRAGADVEYRIEATPSWLFDDPAVLSLSGGYICPNGRNNRRFNLPKCAA